MDPLDSGSDPLTLVLARHISVPKDDRSAGLVARARVRAPHTLDIQCGSCKIRIVRWIPGEKVSARIHDANNLRHPSTDCPSASYNRCGGDALQPIVLGTNVTLLRLASALPNRYVKSGALKSQRMLSLTNKKSGRCARWCALVVLTAIFALTISLTTRYGSAADPSTSVVKASHSFSLQPPGRQRLTNDAAIWVPPVIDCAPLHAPARPARMSSVGSAIPNPSFASIPYYRPPPLSPSFL